MSECGSWKVAKQEGVIRYFTGKPCRRGHIADRFTSSRQCVECQNIRSTKYQQSEKGRLAAKERHIKKSYRLTLQSIQSVTCCQICDVVLDDTRGKFGRCVDHDHRTKEIRGVLCNNCNRALGMMQDDPERFLKAAQYLKADKKVTDEWLT